MPQGNRHGPFSFSWKVPPVSAPRMITCTATIPTAAIAGLSAAVPCSIWWETANLNRTSGRANLIVVGTFLALVVAFCGAVAVSTWPPLSRSR